MSDDEYYDEYDEEYFWIEEPDPTIADDLALTANYDALFFDDPSLDVEDFYSDWDEMSDDYYDEDSTAARRQRVMAKWPNKRRAAAAAVDTDAEKLEAEAERNNRVLSATICTKFHPGTDLSSFRGVVWKDDADEVKTRLHEPGDGEKVALLKNWREVFRSAHPATERQRLRKRAASKADVGGAVRSPRARRGRKRKAEEEPVSDAASEASAVGEAPGEVVAPVQGARAVEAASDPPVNSQMAEHEYPIEGRETYDDQMAPVEQSSASPSKRRRTRANGPAAASPARGRKRKASISEEQPETKLNKTNSKPASGSRSRQTGSKKTEATGSPAAVRRSTRNRNGT
ncbi:hypothetical protein BDV59DRAFT_199278 [Aspergillus ambiguus]|uniref:uncharacterized protein n=1 Tax=Aspergillus ambiguus TaxID=176160 RepID=UPI003CCD54EA